MLVVSPESFRRRTLKGQKSHCWGFFKMTAFRPLQFRWLLQVSSNLHFKRAKAFPFEMEARKLGEIRLWYRGVSKFTLSFCLLIIFHLNSTLQRDSIQSYPRITRARQRATKTCDEYLCYSQQLDWEFFPSLNTIKWTASLLKMSISSTANPTKRLGEFIAFQDFV